jgi:hypothetical protein
LQIKSWDLVMNWSRSVNNSWMVSYGSSYIPVGIHLIVIIKLSAYAVTWNSHYSDLRFIKLLVLFMFLFRFLMFFYSWRYNSWGEHCCDMSVVLCVIKRDPIISALYGLAARRTHYRNILHLGIIPDTVYFKFN